MPQRLIVALAATQTFVKDITDLKMSKKTIEQNLKKALLEEGPLTIELFEYELEEHIEEYLQSKQKDKDKYFLAITEHTNDVAMLLIDDNNTVHVNDDARALLKKLWRGQYKNNIKRLIPLIAEQLDEGYLFAAGVKVVGG